MKEACSVIPVKFINGSLNSCTKTCIDVTPFIIKAYKNDFLNLGKPKKHIRYVMLLKGRNG